MASLKEQWDRAQLAERKEHAFSMEEGKAHFANTYANYFVRLGIDDFQDGKKIIEIGSADFPALSFCRNFEKAIVIEPMPSEILKTICRKKSITLIKAPAEVSEFPEVDEVWILNVLQHVMDPNLIIEKAKKCADIIRFFEPVNQPKNEYHLHTFSLEDFYNYFEKAVVKHYNPTDPVIGFHNSPCAYGTWKKTNKI